MTSPDIPRRLIDHFSEVGDAGDVWDILHLFVDTERFLNIGYSPWYIPILLGSPQQRLAYKMASNLATLLDGFAEPRLIDVGCGRGGSSTACTLNTSGTVVGIDLVPHNIEHARTHVLSDGSADRISLAIADSHHLPFRANSFAGGIAVDSAPYFPDRSVFLTELNRVIDDDGVVAISDVLVSNPTETSESELDSFINAWEFAPLDTLEEYHTYFSSTGWELLDYTDITAGSLGRLRKWTLLYLTLAKTPAYDLIRWVFEQRDTDIDPLTDRVQSTNPVLPALRHVIFYGRKSG